MALAGETPFSKEAADEQIAEARERVDRGIQRFPGMSYEEGVVAALDWALGYTDEIPYTED